VIADMAQVQDRAVVKQRELIEEIEKIKKTGNKADLESAEAKLSELDSEIKNREGKLESLFNKQDQISAEISKLNQKIEDCKAEIQNLREKITEIVEWSNEEKGIPEVKVSDVIFADTTISGIFSVLRLNKNRKNVVLKEDIPKDADDSSDLNIDRDKYISKIRIKQL
jgi:chromosome segregation ATPase